MSRLNFIALLFGCAVLVAVLAGGTLSAQGPAGVVGSAESDNGQHCLSDGKGKGLLQYYRSVGLKTELRPFGTSDTENLGDTAYDEIEPPLWENLGELSFAITTASPRAQSYFDQGLRLSYAFNHAEARRAFRQAQKLDPDCAMCYWGEALVLGPNINAPMEPQASNLALQASAMAQKKAVKASEREQALITALVKRYSADPGAERAALDAAYAEAMGKAAARFPEDENIQVLYAEALMDLTPWDYWEAGGSQPKNKTTEILTALERILARNPDHPGAIHYYIHMVEASDRPQRALPYAGRLGSLMPGAGHLVHMPFHIYFRTGRYVEALKVNKEAAAADEAYIATAGRKGIYPQAYYPHNVHSLMVSAQMAGDGKTAIAAAEKLARVVTDEAARTIPWVQPIQAAPYFAHAQFSAPDAVLALSDPGPDLPFVKAMWHYARGVAYAVQKNIEAAQREAEAITWIGLGADLSGLTAGGIPAPDVLALARHVVLGRIAQAEGRLDAARVEFEHAVAIQDQLPYAEPPHWYYPVHQSLGAVLLRAGELVGAEGAFRASLKATPNNGWALYGLSQVYKRMDDKRAAAEVDEILGEAWVADAGMLDLARM
ncbi:MAG: hypothetical protein ACREX9_04085 [Gammaproteobacteria bacterium]